MHGDLGVSIQKLNSGAEACSKKISRSGALAAKQCEDTADAKCSQSTRAGILGNQHWGRCDVQFRRSCLGNSCELYAVSSLALQMPVAQCLQGSCLPTVDPFLTRRCKRCASLSGPVKAVATV